ncbi:hypothetical protein ACFH04_00860 [Streptomyces noboritoensis]|uniref:Uncharacterized protein n=1 Tax=Streptomyces noboritoensis TaxID=67337 RepID=A0ABV6T940_9ACTN
MDVPCDVVEAGLWDDLAEEAGRCRRHAVVRHNQRPGLLVMRDGSITSPQRCTVHPGGAALKELALSKSLAEIVGEATGQARMTPIRFGFKFYGPGNFMHVHRDDRKCDITFSCGLREGLAPMGWLPRLRWLTSDQVAERLADALFPTRGDAFPILSRQLTGFDGRRIPHWRTPLGPVSREVLITICFADLSA